MPVSAFPARVVNLLWERAAGRCEVCARATDVHSHHRLPRGMGGSRNPVVNSAANGIRVCLGCHDWIEQNRRDAYGRGLLVRRGQDPRMVPVWLSTRVGVGWFLLDEQGGYTATYHQQRPYGP